MTATGHWIAVVGGARVGVVAGQAIAGKNGLAGADLGVALGLAAGGVIDSRALDHVVRIELAGPNRLVAKPHAIAQVAVVRFAALGVALASATLAVAVAAAVGSRPQAAVATQTSRMARLRGAVRMVPPPRACTPKSAPATTDVKTNQALGLPVQARRLRPRPANRRRAHGAAHHCPFNRRQ